MRRISLALAALFWAAPLMAQEDAAEAPPSKTLTYMPPSRSFACDIPRGWQTFEEEDALGPVVHILGPENPSGSYRSGLSVRWFEKGQPGFVDPKKAQEDMRRSDKDTKREAGAVIPMRVAGLLARLFEVVETRFLPQDRLPAKEEQIHSYVAVIPTGSSYYLLRLSSTRDVYLDYRDDYLRCLKTFKPLGR